jgi:hypothetical protein
MILVDLLSKLRKDPSRFIKQIKEGSYLKYQRKSYEYPEKSWWNPWWNPGKSSEILMKSLRNPEKSWRNPEKFWWDPCEILMKFWRNPGKSFWNLVKSGCNPVKSKQNQPPSNKIRLYLFGTSLYPVLHCRGILAVTTISVEQMRQKPIGSFPM